MPGSWMQANSEFVRFHAKMERDADVPADLQLLTHIDPTCVAALQADLAKSSSGAQKAAALSSLADHPALKNPPPLQGADRLMRMR